MRMLLGVLAALALTAGPAQAATNLLDFESSLGAPGTVLTGQAAATGVKFGTIASLGAPNLPGVSDCGAPRLAGSGATPVSGSQFLSVPLCASGGEFHPSGTVARFASPRGEARIFAGTTSGGVTLAAFDRSGSLIQASTRTDATLSSMKELVVSSPAGAIQYLGLYATVNNATVAADYARFPDAPVTVAVRARSATAGVELTSRVGVVYDPDAAPASNFTVQLDWGDGTQSTGTLDPANSPGYFALQGAHTYAQPGSYTVTARATPADTSAGTVYTGSGTVTVAAADQPRVTTGSAVQITDSTAVAQATINAVGATGVRYRIEYGPSVLYGSSTPAAPGRDFGYADASNHDVAVSLSGLAAQTTYHYRVVAQTATGTAQGADQVFTTAPTPAPGGGGGGPTSDPPPPAQGAGASNGPPAVLTQQPANLTMTAALAKASVNPSGQDTAYHFEYGTSTSYGSTTSAATIPADSDDHAVSSALPGLTPGTTYHYRVVAGNATGVSVGQDVTFATAPLPPSPQAAVGSINAIEDLTDTGASLIQTIDPRGSTTSFTCEYVPDAEFRVHGFASPNSAGGGNPIPGSGGEAAAGCFINGFFAPNTTYHVRAHYTNAGGDSYSGAVVFTTTPTPAPPSVTTGRPSDIGSGAALANGTINSHGLATRWAFRIWTTDPDQAVSVPGTEGALGAGAQPQDVSFPAADLQPATTYHVQLTARNAQGSAVGEVQTFTTAAPAAAGFPDPLPNVSPNAPFTSTPGPGIDTGTSFVPAPTAQITDVAAPAGKGRLGFDAGTSTSAPGTEIKSYSWAVTAGGSTIKADCGPGSDSLSGLFLKAGTYKVSLTVTDSAGGRSTTVTQAQLSKAAVAAELGGRVRGNVSQLTPALACTGALAALVPERGAAKGPGGADCVTSWHTRLIHLRSRQNCIDVRYVSNEDSGKRGSRSATARAGGLDQPIRLPSGALLGQQATITGPFELNGLIVAGTTRDTATFDSFGHVRAGKRLIYVAGSGASPFSGGRAGRSILSDLEKQADEFQQKLGQIQLDEDIPQVSTNFSTRHCIASAPPGLRLAGLTFATGFCLEFKEEGTYLKVDLKLPAALGGISGSVTLFQDNLAGFHVDEIHLRSDRASLFGVIGMKDLHFDYLGRENKWQGGGKMSFPPGGGLEVQVGLVNGSLDYLKLIAEPSPGLPLGQGLFLSKIGIDYRGGSGLAFGGIAGITAGTKVEVPLLGKCSITEVTGEFLFTLRPALGFSQTGDANVACIHFGNATFEADVTGRMAFDGQADFKLKDPLFKTVLVEFAAHLGIAFQVPWDAPEKLLRGELPDFPRFQADAGVRGSAFGIPLVEAEAVISTDGLGLCGRPFAAAPYMGAGYVINGPNRGFKVMFDSCNIAQFRLQKRASRAGLPAGAQTVAFPGAPGIGIIGITGADRPPRVLLTGPNGERFQTPAALPSVGPDFVAGEYPSERTTYVVIRKPAAGDWTLTPLDGSATITSVKLGAPGPEPVVHAKVVRNASGFGVKYDLKVGKGQRVRFTEDGQRTSQDLGVASGRTGTIPFTPSEGKPGRRTITALVEDDGMPLKRVKVATYSAPGPTPPGRVGRLRVARSGSGIVVRYKAARDAVLYRVTVSGAGLRRVLETDRTRVRITDLPTTSAVKVSVVALRAMTRGQPVRTRLAGKRLPQLSRVRLRQL